MLIESKLYKGIEYVQLNELPQTQREKLVQTLNKDLFIKILIDGKIVNECLQFKDYSFWYHSVFRPSVAEQVAVSNVEFNASELALTNR